MAEIDKYIREFQDVVDSNANTYGSDVGEFGVISRIMYNADNDVFYYLHFRRDWFNTFGKQFNTIPPEHRSQKGTSVPYRQLESANKKTNAFMIIIYENRADLSRTYYGCHARLWYQYVIKYKTLFRKEKSRIDSIMEGCIPISMLDNMVGFMK